MRKQGEWVYATVGKTEVRGKKVPAGVDIEQVSPTYDVEDFDAAVNLITKSLGVGRAFPQTKERKMAMEKHSKMNNVLVTVGCPLCDDIIEVPEYDSITRTDALMGHIVTRHTNKLLPTPPTEGPPVPKGLNVKWPWR